MAEKCSFWVPWYRHCQWQPAADIYRTRKGWLIKCDLAGIHRDDVEVTLTNRQLKIAGHRRDWQIDQDYHVYSLEIVYAQFERTIELPHELEEAQIQIDYRDGMLLVFLTSDGEEV